MQRVGGSRRVDTPSGTQDLTHRQMGQVLGPSAPPPAHGAKGGGGGPPAGGLISWAPAQPPAGRVASCGYATDRSEAKLRAPANCANSLSGQLRGSCPSVCTSILRVLVSLFQYILLRRIYHKRSSLIGSTAFRNYVIL